MPDFKSRIHYYQRSFISKSFFRLVSFGCLNGLARMYYGSLPHSLGHLNGFSVCAYVGSAFRKFSISVVTRLHSIFSFSICFVLSLVIVTISIIVLQLSSTSAHSQGFRPLKLAASYTACMYGGCYSPCTGYYGPASSTVLACPPHRWTTHSKNASISLAYQSSRRPIPRSLCPGGLAAAILFRWQSRVEHVPAIEFDDSCCGRR